MGQTREVTTVRFCVRDSFEEVCFKSYGPCSYPIWSLTLNNQRVIELQESKRNLAGILLNTTSEGDGQSNNKVRQLEVCIKLYLATKLG